MLILPPVYTWLARDHRIHSTRQQQLAEIKQTQGQ